MLVCVDANVMLQAFARGSPLVRLFQAIGSGKIRLALSTEILLEYEEIATQQGGAVFASKMLSMLSLVAQVHRTSVWTSPSFVFM